MKVTMKYYPHLNEFIFDFVGLVNLKHSMTPLKVEPFSARTLRSLDLKPNGKVARWKW